MITAEDVSVKDMLAEFHDFDADLYFDEPNAMFSKVSSEADSPCSPSADLSHTMESASPQGERSVLDTDLWDLTDETQHPLCDSCEKTILDASEGQIFAFGKCGCVGPNLHTLEMKSNTNCRLSDLVASYELQLLRRLGIFIVRPTGQIWVCKDVIESLTLTAKNVWKTRHLLCLVVVRAWDIQMKQFNK